MSKTFFDLFPPPKFLEMPSVGFSVADTAVRFIELREHEGSFVVGDYAQRQIAPGVVDAGYVHKPEDVVAVLKALKKEYGLHFVRATLPEEKGFVFHTQIPVVVPEELRSTVEFTIEENVPMSVTDVEFDFTVIPSRSGSTEHINVAVSVVPKKVVETYLSLFTEADLVVTAFELESQAVARALVEKHDLNSYLIVNLDKHKTGFYIVRAGAVTFTSTMIITAATLPELTEEINKIYWHAHGEKKEKGGTKVSKILLCGEEAGTKGLKEHIFNNLGIEVEEANVWKNVFVLDKYVPDISHLDSLSFPAPIGLSLPESPINLLPQTGQKAVKKEYSVRRATVALATFAVTVFVSAGFLLPAYILSNVRLNSIAVDAQRARAISELQDTQDTSGAKIQEAKEKLALLQVGGVGSANVKTHSVRDIIDFLTKDKGNNVRVQSISYSRGTAGEDGAAGTDGAILLGGLARNRESLTAFVRFVESHEVFKTVNVPVSNFAKDRDITFSMNITGSF